MAFLVQYDVTSGLRLRLQSDHLVYMKVVHSNFKLFSHFVFQFNTVLTL